MLPLPSVVTLVVLLPVIVPSGPIVAGPFTVVVVVVPSSSSVIVTVTVPPAATVVTPFVPSLTVVPSGTAMPPIGSPSSKSLIVTEPVTSYTVSSQGSKRIDPVSLPVGWAKTSTVPSPSTSSSTIYPLSISLHGTSARRKPILAELVAVE